MSCRLAVAQAAATRNVNTNYATLVRLVQQARQQGCQALCLPEAFLTGYDPTNVGECSLTQTAEVLGEVAQLAQSSRVELLVGFQEQAGESHYLTQGLFLADGTIYFYRKTHLGRREAKAFTPGQELPVFQLSCGAKIGLALCVESHFPQLIQTLALRGAELVFAPHAVPAKAGSRQEIWSRYIPTRSYDNRLYMACCNLWDGDSFSGGCLVTMPTGEELSSFYGTGERLLVFDVDLELVKSYRENNSMGKRFYPAFRRQELYE